MSDAQKEADKAARQDLARQIELSITYDNKRHATSSREGTSDARGGSSAPPTLRERFYELTEIEAREWARVTLKGLRVVERQCRKGCARCFSHAEISQTAYDAQVAERRSSLESTFNTFAKRVIAKAGTLRDARTLPPLRIEAPTMALTGATADALGETLVVGLHNALASLDAPPKILAAGESSPAALSLRLQLTVFDSEVQVAAGLRELAAEPGYTPVEGFRFPWYVGSNQQAGFGSSEPFQREESRMRGGQRIPDAQDFEHRVESRMRGGQRPGRSGLGVWLDLRGLRSLACDGDEVVPTVRVNRPAHVRVFSVLEDGRAWQIFPAVGEDDRVETELALGPSRLTRLPGMGREAFVAVAGTLEDLGEASGWTSFCRLSPDGLREFLNHPVAVWEQPYLLLPSDDPGCAISVLTHEDRPWAVEELEKAPICGEDPDE